jgi:hypothetical protein
VSHYTLLVNSKARCVAHNPEDILSPCGLYQIICAATHPDQKHIYHYKVPQNQTLRRQLAGFGFEKILLDADRRMGKNKVGQVSTLAEIEFGWASISQLIRLSQCTVL